MSGSYLFKGALEDLPKEDDNSRCSIIEAKMANLKNNQRNLTIDFSGWQATTLESKRTMRHFTKRLDKLDEQNQEIDLSELEGKVNINVSDIVKVLRTLQSDILAQCVT